MAGRGSQARSPSSQNSRSPQRQHSGLERAGLCFQETLANEGLCFVPSGGFSPPGFLLPDPPSPLNLREGHSAAHVAFRFIACFVSLARLRCQRADSLASIWLAIAAMPESCQRLGSSDPPVRSSCLPAGDGREDRAPPRQRTKLHASRVCSFAGFAEGSPEESCRCGQLRPTTCPLALWPELRADSTYFRSRRRSMEYSMPRHPWRSPPLQQHPLLRCDMRALNR